MELVKMQRYESYRDSGVDWIGIVPTHWSVTRLGSLFEERRTKVSDEDFPPLSVTKNGILPQLDSAAKTKDGDNRKLVKAGDFVINSRSDRKGSSGVSDRNGSVSLINIVLKPRNVLPKFCNYVLKSNAFIEEYYRVGRGIVADLWTTRYDEMRTMMLVIPPSQEQTAIANFLDQKTAQIDEAIAIKERQIELLKERKQIIIQKAVTQGLNPNVPMKDSEVEWIGKVPKHWIVSKIGMYSKVFNGSTPNREISRYWLNGTIPWISSGKVNDFIVNEPSEYISESALRECSLRVFPKGTIIIGIVGQGKTRGTTARLNLDTTINQNVAGIIPSKFLSSDFLHLYLIQAYSQIRNQGQGSNQEALNCSIVSSFPVVIPAMEEQQKIIEFIENQSLLIEQSISIQAEQIEKLKEYKTTLINSAVTGKIKVTDEN
ncbi:restriction endonuclease subunit S [Cellvibrio sp. KY-GH-1]|uniref:restriction endonuclease subunit S n=1 Tax=Cellvibrio sp. KY-GH-1 TaxID=2303332 RepID=UPI001248A33F|nr:restriction endonuclease subunit S [Cellvibrio sp. KY-GH-1]QEY16276.1 restriction endonuclease subunit S [Cellvibrio sp. KY-GH-1]